MEDTNDDMLIVITTTGCPTCEEIKKSNFYDTQGKEVHPKIMNIQDSDEAVEIAIKENLTEIPVVFKKNGSELKKCKLGFIENGKNKKTIIDCG